MNEKQRRAKLALDELSKLGFSQNTIALRLGVDPTTICHINALRPESISEFYVSERLAGNLEQLLLDCCRERCDSVLPKLPIQVIETCHHAGVMVTEEVRAQIRLSMEITLSSKFDLKSPPVSLPDGIAAAIAYLGDDLVLIKMQPHDSGDQAKNEANRKRLLIHELEHLIQRIREGLPESKEAHDHQSEY
jgi:hypothetical protein